MKTNNTQFNMFNQQYKDALTRYLNDDKNPEFHFNIGYQLGRDSIADDLGILTVVAIHHDSLIEYMENIRMSQYDEITDKASVFLEEVLAPYQMIAKGFQEAIALINKNIVMFATRIQEKESLLKEVYHRVKNNLQVITSLINLQIDTVKDSTSKNILIESEARVKSMALIHEMLYQSKNLSKINMKTYINFFVHYLVDTYNVDTSKIQLDTDIEPLSLDLDYAIPCGLIIHELISNAIKHAFSKKRQGHIQVSFKKSENKIQLSVADDGVGLPDTFNMNTTTTLGARLIESLAKQINGTIQIDKKPGACFKITFLTNGFK